MLPALLAITFTAAPGWQAGFAAVPITPDKPQWMAGYAARTAPAEGKDTELYTKAAVLVPPGDAVAVADALRGLLTDPERRAEYGRRGRAHAETWPTEADTVASVRAIYGELTGQARAARARAARSVTATGTPVRPVAGGDVAERG